MNTLREALEDYLIMRRGLGFKLRCDGQRLLDFVSFLEERGATYITTALALEWAQQPSSAQPVTWKQRLSYVRGFARYRSATDSQTEIPSSKLLPGRPERAQPYLYNARDPTALGSRPQAATGRWPSSLSSRSRAGSVSAIVRVTPCLGGVNFRTFAFHCWSTRIVPAWKSILSQRSASSSPGRIPSWTATSR